jgi:uncharacterized protein (DUF1697 family)
MAESFAAFLRGVNVNGNKISMVALREAFADMGFPGARTELNTGNVIFTAQAVPADRPRTPSDIESGLKAAFGYDAPIFLRSVPELEALRGLAQTLSVPESCHLYLLLCGNAALPAELEALFASLPHGENESFLTAAGDAFWIVPKGETLASPFGAKALGAARFRNQLTSRNWNTVEKVLGRMRGN